MNILWAGGEDIDFPIIGSLGVDTSGGYFRSGWARCDIHTVASPGTAMSKSNPFNGGALTSAWLSFRVVDNAGGSVSQSFAALGLSGTNSCLGIGSSTTSVYKLCIFKYDGTTRTELALEGGTSISSNTLFRLDMQVNSYGASATVNVYVNGVSVITFTGNVAVAGMTNFDSVFLWPWTGNNGTGNYFSEIFVADSDTRAIQGLQTLALTGAGTTNGWTNNTYTNINGISFSDSNPTYVNTTVADQQYTVTTPTPAVYSVAAVSISARMAKSVTATPTNVKLGYGSAGVGYFGTGASKAVTTGYQTYEQIDAINPVTSAAFTQANLAALQLDLESA